MIHCVFFFSYMCCYCCVDLLTALWFAVFRTKPVTAGQFAMPDVPKKPSPDRQVDGLELVSKVVSSLLPERGEERSKTPEAKEITPKGRMSPLKTSTAKRKPLFSKTLSEETVLKPRKILSHSQQTWKGGMIKRREECDTYLSVDISVAYRTW